jgi:zinc transport system substrate-binding protein
MNVVFLRAFFFAPSVLLASILFSAFLGCNQKAEPLTDSGKLQILVAVDPIVYMVERVGGEHVDVVALTPQGQNPETYAPTPGSLEQVVASRGFLRVGLPIEERFAKNIESIAPNAKTYDLCANLTLLANPCRHDDGEHEGYEVHEDEEDVESLDPHVWTSPANARVIVANIADALEELDPVNAESYAANAEAFDAELASLQAEVGARLAPYEGKRFVVFHPAYGYFAREFKLEQAAIEFEGKAPRPKELQKLIEQAKADGTRKLIVQPEFNRSSAQAIADAIDGELVDHSPLEKDYFVNIRTLTDAVVDSIGSQE